MNYQSVFVDRAPTTWIGNRSPRRMPGRSPAKFADVFPDSKRMPLLAQELNLTISMRVPDRKMTNKIIAVTGQRARKDRSIRGASEEEP
jgi:hypothetical protein